MISALSLNAVRTVAPKNSGVFVECAKHRRDPPALQPAVDDQAGQEEADQQRRLQLDP